MKTKINYYIYTPCGNGTALVLDYNYSDFEKKLINDMIMKKHTIVEQVGFIIPDSNQVLMAGSEFCANAVRSAAYYFLQGNPGELSIKSSGIKNNINVGIDLKNNVWAKIPVNSSKDSISMLKPGIYQVIMEGIIHLVIDASTSNILLKDKSNIKNIAMQIIESFELPDSQAIGVMFLEEYNDTIMIHPVVWVKSINTLFYESACGSGSIATAIVEYIYKTSNSKLDILQPSGHIITTSIVFRNDIITHTIISGKVSTDNVLKTLYIDTSNKI